MADFEPPWMRAGGFPRDEWHKVLMWAVKKHIEAAQARYDYSPTRITGWTTKRADELSADDKRWEDVVRGVLAGDSGTFHDAHTGWMRETGQLEPR
jgi:hypothetical protein